MKRHSVIATLAFALSLGTAGLAAAQSTTRPERPRAAQGDSTGRRGGRGEWGGRGQRGPGGQLLKGITLTADQKARIAELRAAQRKQFEASHPKAAAGARPERQRGDTTGMGARRAEMQARREQQVTALRGILTAEQRTQFDKNVAEMKARGPRDGHGRGNKARKGDK